MKRSQQPVRKPTRSDWRLMAILWLVAFPFMVGGNLSRSWRFMLALMCSRTPSTGKFNNVICLIFRTIDLEVRIQLGLR